MRPTLKVGAGTLENGWFPVTGHKKRALEGAQYQLSELRTFLGIVHGDAIFPERQKGEGNVLEKVITFWYTLE